MPAILAILAVLVASVVVGSLGVRTLRGTGDFLVASRSLGARANAVAVAGSICPPPRSWASPDSS